jgi:antitoxin component HigA of HigAB toxin-antitoxin module
MNTPTKRRRDFPPFATAPTDYVALCDLYLPRPIHSKADARAAAQVVESLAGHALSEGQEDYLEIISHFLDEYDRKHEPQLPVANPLDVLRMLVEERGMTGRDLSRVLGASRNLGAMILRGERRLTADHIRTLAAHFNVPATTLL